MENRKKFRSRRKAPKRNMSFKKINEEIAAPFSAVLNTHILKKPANKLIRTIKNTLGGKRKKKTYRRKCR